MNFFAKQNLYGGFAAHGYGSDPAVAAAREAKRLGAKESLFKERQLDESISLRPQQNELSRLAMEESRIPPMYRNSRGVPFDKNTIAKIEAGVYRDPNEKRSRPRLMRKALNQWDDPEEFAKAVTEQTENIARLNPVPPKYGTVQLRPTPLPSSAGTFGMGYGGFAGGGAPMAFPLSGPKTFGGDPMMQLFGIGQQFGQIRQMINPNLRPKQLEQIPTFPSSDIEAPQSYQRTYPVTRFSSATNFEPVNFQPQMDALRYGIMERMARQTGVNLPEIGQPFEQKYTPYWQQAGMNIPKFPSR